MQPSSPKDSSAGMTHHRGSRIASDNAASSALFNDPPIASTHSSSPSSPRLNPSSPPHGISAISSLNISMDSSRLSSAHESHFPHSDLANHENPATLEVHTLMQMLSLVGSRMWEADQLGLEPALSDAENDTSESAAGDDEDSLASSGEIQRPATGLPPNDQPPIPPQTDFARRLGIKAQVPDDQTTPRGGTTPLAASVTHANIHKEHGRRLYKPAQTSSSRSRPQSSHRSPTSSTSSSSEDEGDDDQLATSRATNFRRPSSSEAEQDVHTSEHSNTDVLSDKLQSMFGLPETETVRSCYQCWLFRSVLLQGTVYLTTGHVLFYAYLPSKKDQVMKMGPIRKRTQKTFRFSRHWAILRGRALSWYDSQASPYFPQDHIDLRDVLSIAPSTQNPRHFEVQTPYRLFLFGLDSEQNRDEWVTAVRRATFRAQNPGESVRISIPLEAIVGVETASSLDHHETVNLQVVDTEAGDFALDEYYFLHITQQAEFVASLKTQIQEQISQSQESNTRGTSSTRSFTEGVVPSLSSDPSLDAAVRGSSNASASHPRSEADQSSLQDPLVDSNSPQAAAAVAIDIQKPSNAAQPASSDGQLEASSDVAFSVTPRANASVLESLRSTSGESFVYPPLASQGPPPPSLMTQTPAKRIPDWVKDVPSRLMSGSDTFSALLGLRKGRIRPIQEVWNSSQPLETVTADMSDTEGSSDLSASQSSAFSLVDESEQDEPAGASDVRTGSHEDPRRLFSLASDDLVLTQMGASWYRMVPISGTLYITSSHLCFYASSLATKALGRTKMILPFTEIISSVKYSAFRIRHHGLVLTIRGHEELFFEFASRTLRDNCRSYIEAQIDVHRSGDTVAVSASSPQERADALALTNLSRQRQPEPAIAFEETVSSQFLSPAVSQKSEDASLLSLRPSRPLHFVILTIGSRGDVQPFLALAKGLVSEGHRVRLATHAEFGPWIQQHGVDFREIGGDPAELMRICVENGTFTLSFFREGVTKFRGWLDELLTSCWDACQGADVIIENPNALAGIHISEALQVPYFRAFTMPWSRTRAYPQAFAVPTKKAGGNYNFMTYVLFDQVLWTASSFQINRWRRDCLSLQPTSLDKLQQCKTPFLYNFSPNLVPKPLDWSEWIHVTGFWFLDNPETTKTRPWCPPEELVAFVKATREKGRKLIYVGWGSITVPDAVGTTHCVIDAVRKSGVSAILSKGWSERLSKGKGNGTENVESMNRALTSSDDIFQIDSAPHDWLFPQLDAACHHGGAGTLGASLRAGIPTIIKPFFGDQFFYGQQVESLGVGSCVRNLTVDALAEAITEATQNAKQIDRAAALGRQIRSEKGVENAIRAIYADMEYARSLIKKGTALPKAAVARRKADVSGRSVGTAFVGPRPRVRDQSSSRPGSRARSTGSAQTTSDEWSVVSGSEEEEFFR